MTTKTVRIFVLALIFALSLTLPAMAKDLTQRLGLGYNYQLGFNVLDDRFDNAFLSNDSLSAKYWFTPQIGVEAMVGFVYAKNEDDKGVGAEFGAKFLYNLIMEQQMNIYTGGGLGLLPISVDFNDKTDNNVGFMLQGFFGTEFFLEGLPNLGFDVEVGLQYIDYDKYQQFGTYGGGFGLFGIRYYF